MNKVFVATVVLILTISSIVVGFFVWQKRSINEINLNSLVDAKSLSWNDEPEFRSILSELQIFESGAKEISDITVHPVKKLNITYTPETIYTFTTKTEKDEIISAASYSVGNDELTVQVYVNSALAPNGDVDAEFNSKLIQMIVYLSNIKFRVTEGAKDENYTSLDARTDYFIEVMKRFHQNQDPKSFPIKII